MVRLNNRKKIVKNTRDDLAQFAAILQLLPGPISKNVKKMSAAKIFKNSSLPQDHQGYQLKYPVFSLINSSNNNILISKHHALVKSIAGNIFKNKNIPQGISYHDIFNYGIEGLIKAKNNFSRKKGTGFEVYASYRIRGTILDHLRKEWKYRTPSAYKTVAQPQNTTIVLPGVSFEHSYLISYDEHELEKEYSVDKDQTEDIIEKVEVSRLNSHLWSEIKTLPQVEQKVIKLIYAEEKNQKEISQLLDLSRSKVNRIHSKIIKNLKSKFNSNYN
jgi:RNA polymerase sigma factor FliA